MNQDKIGKYIAELRRKNNLTQEQLGEKVGVGAKSVSKWERGINMPDFSNLSALANVLEVTVNKILEAGNNSNDDEVIVNTIKYYSNNYRKKYIKIFAILVVLLIAFFSFIFFVNNFNKDKLYIITTNDSKFSLKGYLFYNPNCNTYIINKVTFQSELAGTTEEPLIKKISIFLKNNKSGTFGYEKDYNDAIPLGVALEGVSLDMYEEKYESSYVLGNKNKLSDLILIIEVVEENGNKKNYEIQLEVDEVYSNNKLFY